MKRIRYIGIYDFPRGGKMQRDCSLAAVKKMNYVISCVNRLGYEVDVVSIARDRNKTQGKTVEEIPGLCSNRLILLPALGSSIRLIARAGELIIRLWLFFWLLIHVRRKEKILVYHTQRIMNALYWAAKVKGFKYILETEELYYKFGFVSEKDANQEIRCIMYAESLIVSTKNISEELKYKKKVLELHGNYLSLSQPKECETKEHYQIVFAGGIETVRNTAFNVCDCAEFLDNRFEINILGYGDPDAITLIKQKIKKINDEGKGCKIRYCGTKVGPEYDTFLQSCDIGINFQNMDEYYMRFAFPSKVLNYLNYNLLVVTTPLESIRCSKIDKLVYYPDELKNTPKAFAHTLNNLNLTEFQTKKEYILNCIREFDAEFTQSLGNVISYEDLF